VPNQVLDIALKHAYIVSTCPTILAAPHFKGSGLAYKINVEFVPYAIQLVVSTFHGSEPWKMETTALLGEALKGARETTLCTPPCWLLW